MSPGQVIKHAGKHYIAAAPDSHNILGCKGQDGKECVWHRHGEEDACQCPDNFPACFADESVVFQLLTTKKRGVK